MFESGAIILTTVFSILFLVAPFIVNAFYQHRARCFSDEIIKGNTGEFNRQIRANAVILLVRRSLWAVFMFLVAGLYFRRFFNDGLDWWLTGIILLGLGCFAFGIIGYRTELQRLKTLE